MEEEKLVIKQSFSKQVKLNLLALLMVTLGIIIVRTDVEIADTIIIGKVIGYLGICFFGLCEIYIFMRLIKPKDILIVDEQGIVEQSNATSLGFIPWENIEGFHIVQVHTEKFIGVKTSGLEEKINSASIFKRMSIQANLKLGYPAVSITLNSSKYNYDEVLEILEKYYQKYK